MKEQQIREWTNAIEVLSQWDRGVLHLDDLLERYRLDRLRWLVMESFRTRPVIDSILAGQMKRSPRPRVMQILRLAIAELLFRDSERRPRIVNHAVDVARGLGLSKPEVGFINGVLRSVVRKPDYLEYSLDETVATWLLARWRRQYGVEALALLLEWNNRIPLVMIRGEKCPDYAEPTEWKGFFKIPRGRFHEGLSDLEKGVYYVQDPFTRIPLELLDVQPGEIVMDLCAAPGGKSRCLLQQIKGEGCLIAVDKAGPRLERLRANLELVPASSATIIGADVRELENHSGLGDIRPGIVDAVLIDVPCSNTGVIQKRPDVQLRLKEGDIQRHADLQLELLCSAASWLRPGGRLVYSTCSLEEEENSGVVDEFLRQSPDWELQDSVMSLPWICGHDGGGAFLLTKSSQT